VNFDGSLSATGHSGGIINLWNQDQELVRTISAYAVEADRWGNANVVAVEFSPDGQILVSRAFGTDDDPVKLWDVRTGQMLGEFGGDTSGGTDSIVFSPDGEWLAGYFDGTYQAGVVRLWDITSGEVVADIDTEVIRPHAIAFSPDGQYLAIAGLSDRIEVWQTDTRTLAYTFTTGLALHHVYSIAFAPNGYSLVTAGASVPDTESEATTSATSVQGTFMVWALPCDDIQREAGQTLRSWANAHPVEIDHVIVYPTFNGKQDVEIFYRTEEELQQFSQDGTSERLREEAVSAVKALGCDEAQRLQWVVRFQSSEHVQENYRGSYQFYYQR